MNHLTRNAVAASAAILLTAATAGAAQASRAEPPSSFVGDPAITLSLPNVVSTTVLYLIADAQAANERAALADLRR